jgi:hypothetical protein
MYARSAVLFQGGFEVPTEEDIQSALATLSSWLRDRLGEQGVHVGEPEWCGYEFELPYQVDRKKYALSVSYDFVQWEWFQIYYPTEGGIVWRLRGGRHLEELSRLSQAINSALLSKKGVRDIRWYDGFPRDPDKGFTRTPL